MDSLSRRISRVNEEYESMELVFSQFQQTWTVYLQHIQKGQADQIHSLKTMSDSIINQTQQQLGSYRQIQQYYSKQQMKMGFIFYQVLKGIFGIEQVGQAV